MYPWGGWIALQRWPKAEQSGESRDAVPQTREKEGLPVGEHKIALNSHRAAYTKFVFPYVLLARKGIG